MEQDTRNNSTNEQNRESKRVVPPRRFWWMVLVRGSFTIAFGLLFLAARSFTPYLLIYSLGGYLIIDSLLELYSLHKRKIIFSHRGSVLDSIGGFVSLLIGLLCILFPHITLSVLTNAIGLLIIVNSVSRLRKVGGVSAGSLAFRWISNSFLVLLGLFLLLFPSFVVSFFVFFLGSYMLVAGSSLLYRGFSLRFPSQPHSSPSESTDIPASLNIALPSLTRHAIVFVRRTGATGLGHIGWGFEWRDGWFYVGSVENTNGNPFANPEDMGFWCIQTRDPFATMYHRERPYDEYKLFSIPQSHRKDAWKTLIWESQEPYSFVHHNCCDVAYEILHSYGSTEVLDPAQEYIPNDWYDALPGTSHTLGTYPALLVSQHRQSQREITPIFLSHLPGSPPHWRIQLRRPWEELSLILQMMIGHLQARLHSGYKFMTRRWPHDTSRHEENAPTQDNQSPL